MFEGFYKQPAQARLTGRTPMVLAYGAHVFTAVLGSGELIGRRLRALAEKFCGGSMTPLLTHLVRADRLTAKQRQVLRALIDELDQKYGKTARR